MINNTVKIFLRFLNYNRPLGVICLIIILFVTSFNLIIPIFFKIIIDYIITNKVSELLTYFFIILVFIILLQAFFRYLQDFTFMVFRQKIERSMIIKYLDEIFKLKIDILVNAESGDLINRATNYINSFQYNFVSIAYYFFYAIFISLIISVLMYFLNFQLFLCMLVFLALHIINYIIFSKKLNKSSQNYYKEKSKNSSLLIQYFDGYIQIATSWLKNNFIQRYTKNNHQLYMEHFKRAILTYAQQVTQNILVATNQIAIFYIGGIYVINNQITPGTLMLFLLLMSFLYAPIYKLSEINRKINDAYSQLKRLYDYIDLAEKENNLEKLNNLERIKSIRISNLSFQYGKDNFEIFNNINCEFKQGNIYLLTGPSGTGKTTLFNLLIRLYDNYKGKIFFNEINSQNISIKNIRKHIGTFIQESTAFTGSIVDNITCFQQSYNELKLLSSAKYSTAASFINKMSYQYNSIIEDGGRNISGGEKQRLSLARFLYDDKDVMLLDEPTSNLDEVNEEIFMKNINYIKKDKIIIIISHKSEIKKYCDHIYKLTNRKITMK